jgi:hypothetical protein
MAASPASEFEFDAVWVSAKPVAGCLTAQQAVLILKRSWLPDSTLKGGGEKAKEGSKVKGKMDKNEFRRACELIVSSGGTPVWDPQSTSA